MKWKKILGIVAIVFVLFIVAIIGFLATYNFNHLKPRIAEIVKTNTGREIQLDGDIRLTISLMPTLTVQSVTFQNASWGSRPDLARIKRLEVQVELLPLFEGQVRIQRLSLFEPDILIEQNASGQSNLAFDGTASEPKESPMPSAESKNGGTGYMPSVKKLQLEKAKITFKGHRTPRTTTLEIEKLTLESPNYGEPLDVTLQAVFKGTELQASGHVGTLRDLFKEDQDWPFELKLTVLGADINLAGSLADPLNLKGVDLKGSVNGKDLSTLQKFTTSPLPKGPYSLSGQVAYRVPDKIEVSDFQLQLADNRVKGEVSVERMAAIPLIAAKLKSDSLDLRSLFEKEEKGPPKERPAARAEKKDKVFPSKPFQLDFLNGFETSLDAEFAQLLLPGIAASELKLTSTLKNGRLGMTLSTAKIGGGHLAMVFDIAPQGQQFNVSASLSAENVDLGRMLKDLKVNSKLAGTMNLAAKLKGQGNSVAGLMAALDGDFIVTTGNGRLPFAYLNLIGTDISASLLDLLNPFHESTDEAAINCLFIDLNIVKGLAKSDIILIDDPRKTLLGHADIDLRSEGLSVWIETKPKEGIGFEQTGKVSISMNALTKPFKLGGTLAHPKVALDTLKTAKTVGTALLGPLGIAWLMVSGTSGQQDPCANALKIVGEGAYVNDAGKPKQKGILNKLKNVFTPVK